MLTNRIDVIIPLYNRKHLIPDLIETLEGQTYRNFRVIFVDDGSSDGTFEALQTMLEDVSFSSLLLHQENKGPSAARNEGIKYATAEWIVFTDSDDVLKAEYLEFLHGAVAGKNVEMGFCQLEVIPFGSKKQLTPAGILDCNVISASEAMKFHYSQWIAPVCLILNREWVQKNRLKYDEGCRYCEDLMFITECIDSANFTCKVSNSLYVYRTHEGSLLRSSDTAKYIDGLKGFSHLESKMNQSESEAARVFRNMGKARFLLGILRKSALQFSRKDFLDFSKTVNYKDYHFQIRNLPTMQRLAGILYSFSRNLFYLFTNIFFDD
ncbi:MAG: glycosyltransferase [Clostridia bacterium]|nr:glycosyltransferase [Clostridia bacterium]